MVCAKASVVGLVAVALAAAGGGAPAEDKKPDKDKLQGGWKVMSVTAAGMEPENKDEVVGLELTFKGGKVTGEPFEAEFKLDASKDPKEIDFTLLKSPNEDDKGKVVPGVYKLEEDKLTVHISYPGGSRPIDFECKQGTRTTLLLLERVKK